MPGLRWHLDEVLSLFRVRPRLRREPTDRRPTGYGWCLMFANPPANTPARGAYDLVYTLSEHNAGRACETCREPAAYYLFTDGETSTFRCFDHLPTATEALNDDTDTE